MTIQSGPPLAFQRIIKKLEKQLVKSQIKTEELQAHILALKKTFNP